MHRMKEIRNNFIQSALLHVSGLEQFPAIIRKHRIITPVVEEGERGCELKFRTINRHVRQTAKKLWSNFTIRVSSGCGFRFTAFRPPIHILIKIPK